MNFFCQSFMSLDYTGHTWLEHSISESNPIINRRGAYPTVRSSSRWRLQYLLRCNFSFLLSCHCSSATTSVFWQEIGGAWLPHFLYKMEVWLGASLTWS